MTDYAAEVRQNIARHGFHVTYVACDDSPSFCYSTGIFETFAIPELFISSLPPNLSHELIGQYVQRHVDTGPVVNERIAANDERFDYFLISVPTELLKDYVLATNRYYDGRAFEYLQLIYPDASLRFPHEAGYDYDQEIIGDFPPLDHV